MKTILSHKLTQWIAATIILLAVAIIMYPPQISFFQKTSEFAFHLMFVLLAVSFIFLVFNQSRLMFISMLGSGLLAFYLKTASNSNMVLPEANTLSKLKIAHINLSSFNTQDDEFTAIINQHDPDIISFQEYTPDWDAFIKQKLNQTFPYVHKMVRIDPYGMACYAKRPIEKAKTFYYNKTPNMHLVINNKESDINLISSYIIPPSMQNKQTNSTDHLVEIENYITALSSPVILLGDFNQVYWTNEIQNFREKARLKNSRRDISILSKAPYDHIFYTDRLECVQFDEITDTALNHLGITGTFQNIFN